MASPLANASQELEPPPQLGATEDRTDGETKKVADTLKGATTKDLTCPPSMVRPMITRLSCLGLASWCVMSWNSTNSQKLLPQDDGPAEWKQKTHSSQRRP
jgi:hypothetical protein